MMNRAKLAALLALLFSTSALAEFDGNYLYEAYKEYDRGYNSQSAFAYMGYIRGVAAMLIVDKKICVDDNFQFTQAFDTVGSYYKAHPKSRTVPPVIPASVALMIEFPCQGSNNSKHGG